MKRALIISIAAHLGLIALLWQVGRPLSSPIMRGYPRTITATLIEKPAVVQTSSAQAEAVEQPPAPAIKPVPSTSKREMTLIQKAKPKPPSPASRQASSSPSKSSASGASAGGSGIKIDAPEFPFPHYLALIQYRIEFHWQPPFSGQEPLLATVYFKITREGELEEVKLEKSSGNPIFDQAALRAVYSANPLPPLPSGSGLQTLGVHFDFAAN
jgi:TonB family protein